ncbi:MAG: hypothetical protein OXR66_06060 [Candidatus Woesearchaeota archaeon]|nr:hypothetical protein [Candidatus Woesearchaeota archaeon]
MKTVITLVVFTAGLLMAASLIAIGRDIGEEEYDKRTCQGSILATRSTDPLFGKFCVDMVANPATLQCPRAFITVQQDQVITKVKGRVEDIRSKYDARCDGSFLPGGNGDCLAENVLAQEMQRCWIAFLEGSLPVFQNVESTWETILKDGKGSGTRACFICSEVTLTEDITNFKDEYLYKKADGAYYEHLARTRETLCDNDVRDLADTKLCWDAMATETTRWPALDQNTVSAGTHAITFIRQGMMQTSSCTDEDIPSMSVQIIPDAAIMEYCTKVITT